MRTHLAESDIPADVIASKILPRDQLQRSGRWSHPEGFRTRLLEPFRKKVAEATDAPFVVEAYSTIDETGVILLARPEGSPELE